MSYFIDEAKIMIEAGKGGDGCVSFRREKFVPYGGPAGGNGGKGGDVVFIVKTSRSTLYHLKRKRIFKAENGEKGAGKNMTGADGNNITIEIPQGTLVKDADTGQILADMTEPEQIYIAARDRKSVV